MRSCSGKFIWKSIQGSIAKRKSLRKLSLINCRESWCNRYFTYDALENLFIGLNERSNLEYLSLSGAEIEVQKNLDNLINYFIADHRALKEVNLSISPVGFQNGASHFMLSKLKKPNKRHGYVRDEDEWASLRPKLGICGLDKGNIISSSSFFRVDFEISLVSAEIKPEEDILWPIVLRL